MPAGGLQQLARRAGRARSLIVPRLAETICADVNAWDAPPFMLHELVDTGSRSLHPRADRVRYPDRARRLAPPRAAPLALVAPDRLYRDRSGNFFDPVHCPEANAAGLSDADGTVHRNCRDHCPHGRGIEARPTLQLEAMGSHLAAVGSSDATGHRGRVGPWYLDARFAVDRSVATRRRSCPHRSRASRRCTGRAAEDRRRGRGPVRSDLGSWP